MLNNRRVLRFAQDDKLEVNTEAEARFLFEAVTTPIRLGVLTTPRLGQAESTRALI